MEYNEPKLRQNFTLTKKEWDILSNFKNINGTPFSETVRRALAYYYASVSTQKSARAPLEEGAGQVGEETHLERD